MNFISPSNSAVPRKCEILGDVLETTSSDNSEELRDNCNISRGYSLNQGANEPDKSLPPSTFTTDPKRPHCGKDSFEDSSSKYNAARQVLGEIIDEAISKIELKTQKQQAKEFDEYYCLRSCAVSFIKASKDGIQHVGLEVHKQNDAQVKGQLNVTFASPLESRRVHTPSQASTVDVTPEINMSEIEEKTSNRVQSPHYVKGDIAVFKSTSDRHDQSPIAFEDIYSKSVFPNSFRPTVLSDNALLSVNASKSNEAFEVQSNTDENNVMFDQINHITPSPMNVMSDEKLGPNSQEKNPSEEERCERKSKEMINDETVEIDNNSNKTSSTCETMHITPRDCQVHYPTKQMFPKIEQDMISSSCDLFDSIVNQQNTCSAGLQTAASVDLLSPSPQVSTKLSCNGSEMENQKQSENSDLHNTNKSTGDLLVPDLDGRDLLWSVS